MFFVFVDAAATASYTVSLHGALPFCHYRGLVAGDAIIGADVFREIRASLSFFFNGPARTEIYTLSLHGALPIYGHKGGENGAG